jgi:hypothetical protein
MQAMWGIFKRTRQASVTLADVRPVGEPKKRERREDFLFVALDLEIVTESQTIKRDDGVSHMPVLAKLVVGYARSKSELLQQLAGTIGVVDEDFELVSRLEGGSLVRRAFRGKYGVGTALKGSKPKTASPALVAKLYVKNDIFFVVYGSSRCSCHHQ